LSALAREALRHVRPLTIGALLLTLATSASAEPANGTLSYKGTTLAVKHAFLVKGPDAVDPKTLVRRLVFSTTDLTAKIRACQTMGCVDGQVIEGMTLDLDAGPRLNYWTALKGGLLQYSGTAQPSSLANTSVETGRVTGRLTIDDTSAGGPKIDVEFDAKLLKEFKEARRT
jgi:hypothetical protein